jgi:hypothetical protein
MKASDLAYYVCIRNFRREVARLTGFISTGVAQQRETGVAGGGKVSLRERDRCDIGELAANSRHSQWIKIKN